MAAKRAGAGVGGTVPDGGRRGQGVWWNTYATRCSILPIQLLRGFVDMVLHTTSTGADPEGDVVTTTQHGPKNK